MFMILKKTKVSALDKHITPLKKGYFNPHVNNYLLISA
jgi:hypothetical protein